MATTASTLVRLRTLAELVEDQLAFTPNTRLDYYHQAPQLRVYYGVTPVVTLRADGQLTVTNGGDFSTDCRDFINELLTLLGRPERFQDGRERGWPILHGPHQGPCALSISRQGQLQIKHTWPALS
jgi:hypothetical protein